MFKLSCRPQEWTADMCPICPCWRTDREMSAPFILKTWCRMTYWWGPWWHSSYWTLCSVSTHINMLFVCVLRTAAGHGAPRSSVKSSSFWEGRPQSFVSAEEFMMIFSEKWDTQLHKMLISALFICPVTQTLIIITSAILLVGQI